MGIMGLEPWVIIMDLWMGPNLLLPMTAGINIHYASILGSPARGCFTVLVFLTNWRTLLAHVFACWLNKINTNFASSHFFLVFNFCYCIIFLELNHVEPACIPPFFDRSVSSLYIFVAPSPSFQEKSSPAAAWTSPQTPRSWRPSEQRGWTSRMPRWWLLGGWLVPDMEIS